ncbi:MAG: NADH-quinone oxidoreductase subunit C [Dehalococcoidales bacterium]|jgi:NADH-quinone oxidoreductase subunit C|nr:NADH-quinone oxidoreductase subunit C [Dehalococcoidales bacterium]MDP7285696.1 NADH-quinone oxidoreductase subunit C [Dehalococcoidales bacterium]MDP7415778.1 NADH-quinone oxidoreductase subunit C [Dehalococcoidales bacterium]|tara:strand:- start:327 stop:767 length:441 start_codon:yes stop_codon:yes gene_type:complete
MTAVLSGKEIARQLTEKFPESIIESGQDYLVVKNESLLAVAAFLKDTPELNFDYLNFITAVDYYHYFEVVYRLSSLEHNHSLVLKTHCADRENPALPSVTGLWQGADFQEREIYDLMGINFEGHPNMKRIFLWEGFAGHPMRKDFR